MYVPIPAGRLRSHHGTPGVCTTTCCRRRLNDLVPVDSWTISLKISFTIFEGKRGAFPFKTNYQYGDKHSIVGTSNRDCCADLESYASPEAGSSYGESFGTVTSVLAPSPKPNKVLLHYEKADGRISADPFVTGSGYVSSGFFWWYGGLNFLNMYLLV